MNRKLRAWLGRIWDRRHKRTSDELNRGSATTG
jgi:hypothetical protein